jgi:small-conductance mechanosensitive channel
MIFFTSPCYVAAENPDSVSTPITRPVPVVFYGDTLFQLTARFGAYSAQQRAAAITQRLTEIINLKMNPDSIRVEEVQGYSTLILGNFSIMAVSEEDAQLCGKERTALSREYAGLLRAKLNMIEKQYNFKNILINIGYILCLFLIAFLLFLGMRKVFPKGYNQLESWEGSVIRPLRIRAYEIISAGGLAAFFILVLKGIRLAISLSILYFLITYTLSLFPWTHTWNVKPVLIGFFLTILTTAAAVVLFKAINIFFAMMIRRIDGWKGTLIKPVKLKTVEVLSEQRIAEILAGSFKLFRLMFILILGYFYITLVFSFYPFTQTWAGTLFAYIINPLLKVISACIGYLPNLFFILVIAYVTRYVIKFIRIIFDEIRKETIKVPGFYGEWADPTYRIVRFLILAFAAIVIFPYLPGSESPIFRGVSVFLGILFSLGSTSAIANIVAGVVITYMRPFKIGDRVKIAETMGDVVEKTLLITRIRTVKNVDITIPNAMVLGSHIINFSSSAQDRGLILHTGITIGYDTPWKKIHELLISAAQITGNVLKEPKPFVLQTSLNDFYVSYELNVYTDQPSIMTKIYSELHQNIQDKFNEAGIEIMSPHYSAIRDGNQVTIPQDYLPKTYHAPSFRILPVADWFNRQKKEPE